MYAWVKVKRDGEELGQGWWERSSKDGLSIELEDVELDDDEEFAINWLANELAQSRSIYPGDTREFEDEVTGARYEIEVDEVHFDYDETLGLLPDGEETVIMDEITGITTDEQLKELVERYVREIRDATEVEPNRRAIEWWLQLVRDTARDVENEPDIDIDDPEYWKRTPDLLEMEVARGLERLRNEKAKEEGCEQ